jgi:hypothetical protein
MRLRGERGTNPSLSKAGSPLHAGWMPARAGLGASVRIVSCCGHGDEYLPSPWGLLPVLEA